MSDSSEKEEPSGAAKRMWRVAVLSLPLFFLLTGQLVLLQIVKSSELRSEALSRFEKRDELPPTRGPIFDRDGRLLAANQLRYQLYVDPYHLRDFQYAVSGLATRDGTSGREVRRTYAREELLEEYESYVREVVGEELAISPEELAHRLAEGGLGNVVWANGLEEEQMRSLRSVLQKAGVRGVYDTSESQRFYPSGEFLAHVLGYVDSRGIGRGGLERAFEEKLKGEAGFLRTERDSRGKEIAAFRAEEKEPRHGDRLFLTLDLGLQERVEEIIEEAWQETESEWITILVMNPKTGELLVVANRPGFDPNTRRGQRINLAVANQYEPGSTFKVVTVGAALDLGLIESETWINCRAIKGNEEFGFGSTRDELRAREVLAYSSNAGAHRIAELVGKTRFARSISAFGFGAPTGVYLSPESSGTVHDPEKWSASSLSRIGIGYEVAVTPLQMLMAFSAVVNGGELLRPQVLSRLESSRGEVLYERQREFRQRVLSREAAHELRSMLRSVVEAGGTGSKADIRGWEVVGKTGTARRFSPEMGAYEKGEYTVSFVGALPAPDPQFSCIVVMDRPQVAASQRSGGALAAPIFQKIAEASIDYLDLIPPGEG